MPLYTISNPNTFGVVLPFQGSTLGPNKVITTQLEAHTVDTDEIQFMIKKDLIRIVVANDPSRDDDIEIFPGPHPAGANIVLNPAATDPVGTVIAGQQYYNTTINEYLYYDGLRSKWLSKATPPLQVGRNGGVATGSYYRGVNGLVLGAAIGFRASHNGTLVDFEYTRTDTDAATFEITSNGVTIASVVSSATSGGNNTLNADFSVGDILAVRNSLVGNQTSNVQAFMRIKWRN